MFLQHVVLMTKDNLVAVSGGIEKIMLKLIESQLCIEQLKACGMNFMNFGTTLNNDFAWISLDRKQSN